jgi:hypothetical protein
MNGFQSPTGIKRPSLPGGGGMEDNETKKNADGLE